MVAILIICLTSLGDEITWPLLVGGNRSTRRKLERWATLHENEQGENIESIISEVNMALRKNSENFDKDKHVQDAMFLWCNVQILVMTQLLRI